MKTSRRDWDVKGGAKAKERDGAAKQTPVAATLVVKSDRRRHRCDRWANGMELVMTIEMLDGRLDVAEVSLKAHRVSGDDNDEDR